MNVAIIINAKFYPFLLYTFSLDMLINFRQQVDVKAARGFKKYGSKLLGKTQGSRGDIKALYKRPRDKMMSKPKQQNFVIA